MVEERPGDIMLWPSGHHYRRWLVKPGAAAVALVAIVVGSNLRRADSRSEVLSVVAILVVTAVVTLGCIALMMKELEERLRRILPWTHRHWVLTGTIAELVVVGVVVGGVMWWF